MSDLHGRGAGAANFAAGAVTEVAKQSGAQWAQGVQPGGFANKAGHKAVAGAVALAVANPIGAVVVGVAAVGVAGYWLYKKIADE